MVRRSRRPPCLAHGARRVRDQPEVEVLAFAERLLGVGRVVGDADYLGARLVELWGSITEPLAFEASARGIRDGVPPQDGPLAAEVRVAEGFAVLVGHRELGRGVTWSEHEAILVATATVGGHG